VPDCGYVKEFWDVAKITQDRLRGVDFLPSTAALLALVLVMKAQLSKEVALNSAVSRRNAVTASSFAACATALLTPLAY
jgi:hypothetical protein